MASGQKVLSSLGPRWGCNSGAHRDALAIGPSCPPPVRGPQAMVLSPAAGAPSTDRVAVSACGQLTLGPLSSSEASLNTRMQRLGQLTPPSSCKHWGRLLPPYCPRLSSSRQPGKRRPAAAGQNGPPTPLGGGALIDEDIVPPGQEALLDTEDMLPATTVRLPARWQARGGKQNPGGALGPGLGPGPRQAGPGRPPAAVRAGAGSSRRALGALGSPGREVRASLAGGKLRGKAGSSSLEESAQRSRPRARARKVEAVKGGGYESGGGSRKGAGGVAASSRAGSTPKASQVDFEIWHLDGARNMKESLSSQVDSPVLHSVADAAKAGAVVLPAGPGSGVELDQGSRTSHSGNGPQLKVALDPESGIMEVGMGLNGWEGPGVDAEKDLWDPVPALHIGHLTEEEEGEGEQEGVREEGEKRGFPEEEEVLENAAFGDPARGAGNGSYVGQDQAQGTALDGTLKTKDILTIAKEPVYQVLEVNMDGHIQQREVSRRQLVRFSGLSQRDIRRIDPSLWMTNSLPALLVRDNAILLKLGSLRAISTARTVLLFDFNSTGAQSFLSVLLERLRMDADAQANGSGPVPFELEVVESALISRTQRLESALMDVEPRVLALLEALPTSLTADNLEELRLCKQALVELGAKAGSLREMLIELLEEASDLRRITAIGRHCRVGKDGLLDCSTSTEKTLAEEEEQEVEMLLEYYLQRCDSVHGQAEKLLDSAKETEDSLAVNLSSRRLEVSRLELLLQVATFAAALGALIAGIFGMNMRNRLEENATAFWLTTFGIVAGSLILFIAMFAHLRRRKIL